MDEDGQKQRSKKGPRECSRSPWLGRNSRLLLRLWHPPRRRAMAGLDVSDPNACCHSGHRISWIVLNHPDYHCGFHIVATINIPNKYSRFLKISKNHIVDFLELEFGVSKSYQFW